MDSEKSTALVVLDTEDKFLQELRDTKKYAPMIRLIQENSLEIQRATSSFNKSQSQFMDNMLTVGYITPIRNVRQILSEMKRTRGALAEAYFNVQKKRIEILKKEESRKSLHGLDLQLCELEINEMNYQIESTMEYVEGAIRKLANYQTQYNSIVAEHGLKGFTEEDFENEEERYHITRAFQQGLSAARSHNGFIDEGNQIYLEQIGINGTQAQIEMSKYLRKEADILKLGGELPHKMQVEWLLEMADKFKGCSKEYAKWKGQTGVPTEIAMVNPTIG